jgi:putative spermidine/putrescine transport system permease protein/spermidine/putrescine transport system permease protein
MSRNVERLGTAAFRLGYVAVVVFMMLPLLVVISTSLTPSGFLHFPPDEVTLKWYYEFLDRPDWIQAFKNSLIIAAGTTVVSTTLGVMAAIGVQGITGRLRGWVVPLFLVPMLVPGVVLGVTLLMYFSWFGMQQTYVGVILAHSLWTTPLVFFLMQAVFKRFNWQLRDAGMDLGASPTRTFFEIILPGIKHGVFASALVSFILSLQEFIAALFLTGSDTVTVPVLAWNSLRNQLSPMISVVSTLLIVAVILLLVPASVAYGFDRLSKQL